MPKNVVTSYSGVQFNPAVSPSVPADSYGGNGENLEHSSVSGQWLSLPVDGWSQVYARFLPNASSQVPRDNADLIDKLDKALVEYLRPIEEHLVVLAHSVENCKESIEHTQRPDVSPSSSVQHAVTWPQNECERIEAQILDTRAHRQSVLESWVSVA